MIQDSPRPLNLLHVLNPLVLLHVLFLLVLLDVLSLLLFFLVVTISLLGHGEFSIMSIVVPTSASVPSQPSAGNVMTRSYIWPNVVSH